MPSSILHPPSSPFGEAKPDRLFYERLIADAQAIGRPFRGEIWDFIAAAPMAKGHGNDGQPFNIATAGYLREPFAAMKHPGYRKVVFKAGVKTLKTFLVESAAAYFACFGTGDVTFYMADSGMAKDHAKGRLMDFWYGIALFAEMISTIPTRHDETTTELYFPGKTVRIWPANFTSTQNINLETVTISDAWCIGNTGFIEQIIQRTSQYPDTKKILVESQGSEEGDDFDRQYEDTDRRQLHVNCPRCGSSQPFLWHRQRLETFVPVPPRDVVSLDHAAWIEHHRPLLLQRPDCGMQRGAEELVKRPDGEYNEAEVLSGTYYECFHCGGAWPDDGPNGATRIALDESSHYVATRSNANPGHAGFNWPKFINRRIPWGERMLEYLKALKLKRERGNRELFKQWIQKDEGRTWDKSLERDLRVRRQEAYDVAVAKHDAWRLCMIIDNQLDLMQQWVMVCAVKQNGSVKQLWRGPLLGLAECRKKQLEYVDAKGGLLLKDQFVFLDGRYKPEQICRHIVDHEYGHWGNFRGERTWFCWNLMQGGRLEYYSHEAEQDKTRKFILGDPSLRGYQMGKFHVEILVYPFAATACGERFEASRDGQGAETLFLDRQPHEPPDEHELSHHSQIHSNRLVEAKSWNPRDAKKKYVPVPASAPDHYFHMWRMMEAIKEHWGVDGVYREAAAGAAGQQAVVSGQ